MPEIIKSMTQFIRDDSLKVVALKGQWGVGKTYFWKKFISDNAAFISKKFKAYSYISLFGVKEVSELRKQIFTNFEMIDDKEAKKHLKKLKPLSVIIKSAKIPYLNPAGAFVDYFENKFINNFLICIDDLERKESSISASSILGLISNLKDEKHCKILIIYNDQKIPEDAQEEIKDYREKVVDLEISYQPSINQNLKLIWPDTCPEAVSEIFCTLNLLIRAKLFRRYSKA